MSLLRQKSTAVPFIMGSMAFIMLFTVNMGFFPSWLFQPVKHSEITTKALSDSDRARSAIDRRLVKGENARGILEAHIRRLSQIIATDNNSYSCGDLLWTDSNMLSGRYLLYPDGTRGSETLFYCEVKNNQVVEALKIAKVDDVRKSKKEVAKVENHLQILLDDMNAMVAEKEPKVSPTASSSQVSRMPASLPVAKPVKKCVHSHYFCRGKSRWTMDTCGRQRQIGVSHLHCGDPHH